MKRHARPQTVVSGDEQKLICIQPRGLATGHAAEDDTQIRSSVGISNAAVGTIPLSVNRHIELIHRPTTEHELFSRAYFNDFRFTIIFHSDSPWLFCAPAQNRRQTVNMESGLQRRLLLLDPRNMKRHAQPSADCRPGDEQNLVCIQPRRLEFGQPDTPQVKIDNSIFIVSRHQRRCPRDDTLECQ